MKLYVYADESITPPGGTFIVALAVVESSLKDETEGALRRLELTSYRGLKKWCDSRPAARSAFIRGLESAAGAVAPFYWRRHADNLDGDVKTAELVAVAIRERDAEDVSRRSITIDALADAKREVVLRVLTSRGIHRKEVHGSRDEPSAFVRLADALAGFTRHVAVRKPYALELWPTVQHLFKEV